MLSLIFNSVHFSRNCIFCRFFASQASFYTQIKFSIKSSSIYQGFDTLVPEELVVTASRLALSFAKKKINKKLGDQGRVLSKMEYL